MNLRKIFGNDVAKKSFQGSGDETKITGKYGAVSVLDGELFDIWFVGPDLEPLTSLRLTNLQRKFPQEAGLIRLTGEAYLRTHDEQLVRFALPLLGVRKKRQLSPEAKQRLTEQLRRVA